MSYAFTSEVPLHAPSTRRDALKSCRNRGSSEMSATDLPRIVFRFLMLFYYIAKNNVSVADIPMYGLVL